MGDCSGALGNAVTDELTMVSPGFFAQTLQDSCTECPVSILELRFTLHRDEACRRSPAPARCARRTRRAGTSNERSLSMKTRYRVAPLLGLALAGGLWQSVAAPRAGGPDAT